MTLTTKTLLTAELEGPALNWAAAKAHGTAVEIVEVDMPWGKTTVIGMEPRQCADGTKWDIWAPTDNPGQAWDLLEAHVKRCGRSCEKPGQSWEDEQADSYFAMTYGNQFALGPGLRDAVTRACVLGVLGATVEIPAQLVPASQGAAA